MKLLASAILMAMFTAPHAQAKTLHVAVLAYDRMNILDFAGPTEVFSDVDRSLPGIGSHDHVKVYSVGYPKKEVQAIEGTKLVADYSLADAPTPDLLIIPGGDVAEVKKEAPLLEWIRRASREPGAIMSVCTGAFLLAEAEILNGKPATTHHFAIKEFKESYPKVRVMEGKRFVQSGNILTTAGVSAGIDGALQLVNERYGAEIEEAVRAIMEYPYRSPAELK